MTQDNTRLSQAQFLSMCRMALRLSRVTGGLTPVDVATGAMARMPLPDQLEVLIRTLVHQTGLDDPEEWRLARARVEPLWETVSPLLQFARATGPDRLFLATILLQGVLLEIEESGK